MRKYWIDVKGKRSDGSGDYVKGRIRAENQSDAERKAEKEATASGIVDITSKTVEPL